MEDSARADRRTAAATRQQQRRSTNGSSDMTAAAPIDERPQRHDGSKYGAEASPAIAQQQCHYYCYCYCYY